MPTAIGNEKPAAVAGLSPTCTDRRSSAAVDRSTVIHSLAYIQSHGSAHRTTGNAGVQSRPGGRWDMSHVRCVAISPKERGKKGEREREKEKTS